MDQETAFTEENIFAQIRKETQDFFYNWTSVVPGYSYNQYYTLKRIHLYLNSKFEDATNYLGREKIFFNIVQSPCDVAMRMLNMDTKDIKLWPTNPKSYFSSYLLEKELKLWLKTSKMGNLLNQMAEELPRYGTVLLEKTKDGAEVVDLRKLICDPTVEHINDSRFVTKIVYMTPTELRETNWDNVEDAITRFGSTTTQQSFEDLTGNLNLIRSTPYVKVYKRYGEVPETWLDGGKDPNKLVRALFIVVGADNYIQNKQGQSTEEEGLIMWKGKWHKDWPFKDVHYNKVKGRWLGLGIVEMLFDVQARINELKNQRRVSMELSSMHLFQTKDKSFSRNALTDLQNGDIIYSPSGIEDLGITERDLEAFDSEEKSYSEEADRLTFAFSALRGEQPNNPGVGLYSIQSQEGSSLFGFKRENLANFLRDFFNDLVMPQLLKDLSPEHIMRFTGSVEEVNRLDDAASEVYVSDYIKQQMIEGRLPTQPEVDIAKQHALDTYRKTGESRFLKIKKYFYDDTEAEFDFMTTNEQADPTEIQKNTSAIMAAIASNPAILDDPRLKMIFYKWAESLGVSQAEIELAEQNASKLPVNQTNENDQQPRLFGATGSVPTDEAGGTGQGGGGRNVQSRVLLQPKPKKQTVSIGA